ncbi:uncharacterized protein LOC141860882 isoform X4 [Acropora palmata]|uniref:uncharacterized protein LOC141860882 isoform X4 n=1 Tax=Acropora palmata TaxID=6131 RepID=UPI003DA051BC
MATSSDSDSNQIQPRRRVLKYEFVWLNERRKSTPRGKDWDQLNRNGRVKEIEINLQMKARHMGELVRTNFPELRNADLTRIRVYKSYSKGSRMERVFSGIPDAKSIKETFNKPSSRRVYLYLKPDTPALSQPSTSASNASGSGSDISAPVVAIQPNPIPPRGQPNSDFSVRAHLASPATHPTPISPTFIGSNGAQPTAWTQQDPTHQITDIDLLDSVFDDNVMEIDSMGNQDHLSAVIEPAETAGVFQTDYSPCGIANLAKEKVPTSQMDRTVEVIQCERELTEGNPHQPLPVFLNLSFDEVCQQGKADEQMILCVVLKGGNVGPVQRLLSLLTNVKDIYFWIAKSGTKSGKQVTEKFGSNSKGTEVFILAPTPARPVLVERYSGEPLQKVEKEELLHAIQQAQASLEGLRNDKERVTIRKEQEEDLERSLLEDRKKAQATVCEGVRPTERCCDDRDTFENKEVYDWAGAMSVMPLFFTLQRRSKVVLHSHCIEGEEVLDIFERNEDEVKSLLYSQVGNIS